MACLLSTPLDKHPAAWRAREHQLVDECLAAQAVLLGKRMELAYHAGLRDDAVALRASMEKVIRERRELALQRAEERGENFFVAAGAYDGRALHSGCTI